MPAPPRAPHAARRIRGRCYYCGRRIDRHALTCKACRPLYETDPLGASARRAAA